MLLNKTWPQRPIADPATGFAEVIGEVRGVQQRISCGGRQRAVSRAKQRAG